MLTRWTIRTQAIPTLLLVMPIFLIPVLGVAVRPARWHGWSTTASAALAIQTVVCLLAGVALRVYTHRLTAGTPETPHFEGGHAAWDLLGEWRYRSLLRDRGITGKWVGPWLRDYYRHQLRASCWGAGFGLLGLAVYVAANFAIALVFPEPTPRYFLPPLIPMLACPAFILGFLGASVWATQTTKAEDP